MKKILRGLPLALLMLIFVFTWKLSAPAAAVETWSLSGGVLTIDGLYMNSYSTTNRPPWYNDRAAITEVVFGQDVRSIGNYAFSDCTNLTTLNFLGDRMGAIHSHAFFNCRSLTTVELPNSVTTIEEYAFSNCSLLENITLSNQVTTIGEYAFSGCAALDGIDLPNTVTSIGKYAFSGCSALTHANLPSELKTLLYRTFYSCGNLSNFVVPSGAKLETIEWGAFERCYNLKSFRIPEKLKNVRKPSSMSSETTGVFSYGLNSFTIEAGTTTIPSDLFRNCEFRGTLVIPDGIVSIGDSAFYCSGYFTELSLPDSLTSIGDSAFYNCYKLTKLSLPDSVITIGVQAFRECRALTEVEIPEGLQSIGAYAFDNCMELKSIRIPKSLINVTADPWAEQTHNYPGPFSNTGIIAAELVEGSTTICSKLLAGMKNLERFTVPTTVKRIESYAFWHSEPADVWFNSSAPVIDSTAFTGVTTNVHYAATDPSWTNKTNDYGGSLTWFPYDCVAQPVIAGVLDNGTPVLSWNVVPDAVSYEVFRSTKESTGYSQISSAEGTSFRDEEDLVEGTTYFYKLRSVDVNGLRSIDFSNIVRITALEGQTVDVPTTAVRFDSVYTWSKMSLEDGSKTFRAIVSPDNASNKELQWSSSNENVLTVDETGCVTPIAPGTATVTVRTVYGGYTANYSVTVPVSVTGITLDKEEIYAALGSTVTVRATVTPANATFKKVNWGYELHGSSVYSGTTDTSANISVGNRTGTTIFVARTEDRGYMARLTVNAIKPFTSMQVNPTSLSLYEGENAHLSYTLTPSDASTEMIRWKSNDESVATVDQYGNVIAVSPGTVRINAVASWGNESHSSGCTITVLEIPEQSGTCGDAVSWGFLKSDGSLLIDGSGDMADFPDGAPWAELTDRINVIRIGEGVTSIGSDAFSMCVNVPSVVIPDGVTKINAGAFTCCYSLESVTLNGSAPVIADNAFTGVHAEVRFPLGNMSYTEDMFRDYGGELEWVRPTFTVTYDANGGEGAPLPATAYVGKSLTITQKEPVLDGLFFLGWSDSPQSDYAEFKAGGTISRSQDVTLYAVWKAPDLQFPGATETIESEAFEGTSFTTVVIPDTITEIGDRAFADCSTLEKIYIPETVTEIADNAFENVNGLTVYCAPESAAADYAEQKDGLSVARTAKTFTVTYDAGEGLFSDGTHSFTAEADEGEYSVVAEKPIRDGFRFSGWMLDEEPLTGILLTESVTFTASWIAETPRQYLVTYKAGPGTFSNGSDTMVETVTAGNYVISAEEPTRNDHYQFTAWTLDGEPISGEIVISSNTVFEAAWQPPRPTGVTIDTTDSEIVMYSENPQPASVTLSAEITGLTADEISSAEYLWESSEDLVTWGMVADGDTTYSFEVPAGYNGITYYRVTVNGFTSPSVRIRVQPDDIGLYEVLYDANGGRFTDGASSKAVSMYSGENQVMFSETDLVYENHRFTGWYLNDQPIGETIAVHSDILLTARWEEGTPEQVKPTAVLITAESDAILLSEENPNQNIVIHSQVEGVSETADLTYLWEYYLVGVDDLGDEPFWQEIYDDGWSSVNETLSTLPMSIGEYAFKLTVNGVESNLVTVRVEQEGENDYIIIQSEQDHQTYYLPQTVTITIAEGGEGRTDYFWYKSSDQQNWTVVGSGDSFTEQLSEYGVWYYELEVDGGVRSNTIIVTMI